MGGLGVGTGRRIGGGGRRTGLYIKPFFFFSDGVLGGAVL